MNFCCNTLYCFFFFSLYKIHAMIIPGKFIGQQGPVMIYQTTDSDAVMAFIRKEELTLHTRTNSYHDPTTRGEYMILAREESRQQYDLSIKQWMNMMKVSSIRTRVPFSIRQHGNMPLIVASAWNNQVNGSIYVLDTRTPVNLSLIHI